MITIYQNASVLTEGVSTSFKATGGVAPYTYSVVSGGTGGTIDSATGFYTAPYVNIDPSKKIDTILVTDSTPVTHLTATATIAILQPLSIFCDILAKGMGLSNNQVYLWDQKIDIPQDSKMYIAVGIGATKIFGSSVTEEDNGSGGLIEVQTINAHSMISIDILSRGPEARDRKEDVIFALGSTYSKQQQETNSLKIARISSGFINLSSEDGSAIPYRFNISVALQYSKKKVGNVNSYNTFPDFTVLTND